MVKPIYTLKVEELSDTQFLYVVRVTQKFRTATIRGLKERSYLVIEEGGFCHHAMREDDKWHIVFDFGEDRLYREYIKEDI